MHMQVPTFLTAATCAGFFSIYLIQQESEKRRFYSAEKMAFLPFYAPPERANFYLQRAGGEHKTELSMNDRLLLLQSLAYPFMRINVLRE